MLEVPEIRSNGVQKYSPTNKEAFHRSNPSKSLQSENLRLVCKCSKGINSYRQLDVFIETSSKKVKNDNNKRL